MIAADTNVLVYALRRESRLHEPARRRLVELGEGSSPWGIPAFCIAEFVRVVTHPKVFRPPTQLTRAFEFLDALLESPSLRLLSPGPDFSRWFRDLAIEGDAVGNLAFDAQIAAVCLEHGVREILTADRDFARFAGLAPVWL